MTSWEGRLILPLGALPISAMSALDVALPLPRPGISHYSEDVHNMVVELAGEGATNTVIARCIGMNPDSFQDWMAYGRKQPEKYPHYAKLVHDMEETRARLAVEMSKAVIAEAKAGRPNSWTAAMTFLERRYPGDWSKREVTVHEGMSPQELPQINILVLNDPSARSAHRDLLRSVARSGPGIALGPGMGSEREAGSEDGGVVLDVADPASR